MMTKINAKESKLPKNFVSLGPEAESLRDTFNALDETACEMAKLVQPASNNLNKRYPSFLRFPKSGASTLWTSKRHERKGKRRMA